MARRWERAAALVAAVGLVAAAVGGTAWATARTRDLRRQTAEARAGANAELAGRIVRAEELRTTRATLVRTSEQLSDELSRIRHLDSGVDATLTALTSGRKQVTAESVVVQAQAAALAVMQACLTGVERALTAAQRHQFQQAVLLIAAVEQPCRAALDRSPASSAYALVDANFPDPYLVTYHGEYFAYATNGSGGSVQMARGKDLSDLRLTQPALDRLPAWGSTSKTWAPSVLVRLGYWVMFYSLQEKQSHGTCISRAVATSPAGPFVDDSASPFLCQTGGSIDPSPMVDADGSAWLIWKAEQFFPGGARTIYSQRLSADGLTLEGPATPLITADQRWEAGVVEGPSMIRHGDSYLLFYSGGDWNTSGYAVGYAVCTTPAGPCTKPRNGPLYSGGDGISGTGGQEVFTDKDGRLRMIMHGWAGAEIGYPNPRRAYLADLDLSGPEPHIIRHRIGG
jgi:hypothetical protein